jgi:hypothetical protein
MPFLYICIRLKRKGFGRDFDWKSLACIWVLDAKVLDSILYERNMLFWS